jgi:type II secretory pathway pseudopilin PulG
MTGRGFSLLEAMVSVAMVGVLGAGSLALASHVTAQGAENRLRALATTDGQATLERVVHLASISARHGGAARFCELLKADGGPLAGGTTPAGLCPFLSTTGVPVAGAPLQRSVDLTEADLDGAPALRVAATLTGRDLRRPVVFSTLLPLAGLR